jgi:hypothetical protein
LEFCFFEAVPGDVRLGAVRRDGAVVDVHLAEVLWLAERAPIRRAYQVAANLVPADPSAFLSAGAGCWNFARQAVQFAAGASPLGPRGETVVYDAGSVACLDVLEHLVCAAADFVDRAMLDHEAPVAVIVGSHVHRIGARGWGAIAAFVRTTGPRADARRLWTADELDVADQFDATLKTSAEHLLASHSETHQLAPGDLVFTAAAGRLHLGDLVAA